MKNKNIIQYLIENGFTPYRMDVYTGKYHIIENYLDFFSSTLSTYLDIRFKKDNIEIIYGLHERNHPPTIIYPRPSGVVTDYDMDRYLEKIETYDVFINDILQK